MKIKDSDTHNYQININSNRSDQSKTTSQPVLLHEHEAVALHALHNNDPANHREGRLEYSHSDNKLNTRNSAIADSSVYRPKLLRTEAENKLKAITGPTRVGANALIAKQLDHIEGINKPSVISDHLPVSFSVIQSENSPPLSITSWNLLADIHLINNFRNIKLDSLIKSLGQSEKLLFFSYGNNISAQWLLSDLAAELSNSGLFNTTEIRNEFYRGSNTGIKIFLDFLDFLDFLENYYVNGKNAVLLPSQQRSKKEQASLRLAARSALKDAVVELSKKGSFFSSTDFYGIAVHALKLHYTLKSGSMSWENRKTCLLDHKVLLDKISGSQVILLQECTDPAWFVGQLNTFKENPEINGFDFIEHKYGYSETNSDHCVIIYDKSKWKISAPDMDIVGFHFGGNKPALLVRLSPNQMDTSLSLEKPVIIGSVHYPGGNDGKNHLLKITEQLEILGFKEGDNIIVAGDLNQSKRDLAQKIDHLHKNQHQAIIDYSSLKITEPVSAGGTMGGADWDRAHEGHKVDLAFSNMDVTGSVYDLCLFI